MSTTPATPNALAAAHTKGPWHINAIDKKKGQIVGDETTAEHWDVLQINNYNATIAQVYRRRDARLIALAPDLLAHLKECVKYLEMTEVTGGWILDAKAAIEQAEGGAK